MRSLVSCKLLRLLVFVRRQQLAKNISRGFFIARHIYRNTWRETKTFKRAVKHISHHKHLNAGSIQVMELVFHECIGCIRHSYTQTKGNRYEICMCYYTVLRSSPSSLSPTITLPNWMKKLYTFWTQCDLQVRKFWISGETSLKYYSILYAFLPTSFCYHFFSHVKIHPFLE